MRCEDCALMPCKRGTSFSGAPAVASAVLTRGLLETETIMAEDEQDTAGGSDWLAGAVDEGCCHVGHTPEGPMARIAGSCVRQTQASNIGGVTKDCSRCPSFPGAGRHPGLFAPSGWRGLLTAAVRAAVGSA